MTTATAVRTKPRPPMNKSKGSILVRLALTQTDFDAIEHIRAKHGHTQKAPTVRMCIEQQRLRDLAYGSGEGCPSLMNAEFVERLIAPPRVAELRDAVSMVRPTLGRPWSTGGRGNSLPGASALIQWSMWMYRDHKQYIQRIMEGWSFELDADGTTKLPLQQTDAFRLSIRIQAILDGFTPPKKGWS